MLLHVSILRSFSGSTYCSLLKLSVKKINTLLYIPAMQPHIVCMFIPCWDVGRSSGNTYFFLLKLYVKMINTLLYIPVMQQHIVCVLQGGRPTDRPTCNRYNIHTYTRYAAASPGYIIKYLSF